MQPPVDLINVINKKGLNGSTPYKGVVVDNNDPDTLCRIQVRIPIIHDGIPDEHLPWAIPEDLTHSRGLVGGNLGRSASLIGIPVKGSFVAVFFRHKGDPNLASYSHKLPITADTMPEEFLTNYPDTYGSVHPSGMFHLHNARTNETFINLPGDAHVTIFGDCSQTVIGNYQIKVAKTPDAIPSYLKNNISSLLNALDSNQQTRVPFNGLGDKSKGNLHLEIEGDLSSRTQGNSIHKVEGDLSFNVDGDINLDAVGNIKNKGKRIDLN